MKTHSFNSARLPGGSQRLAATINAVFLTACLTGLMATSALATTRNWTGANSGNWSDPNNWSPAGTPANGDRLQFGFVSSSHNTMNNDIFGLDVAGLHFIANNFTLNGNTLLISGDIDGDQDHVTQNSFTVTINCDLSFPVGGDIFAATGDGTFFQSTEEVDLNGHIQVVSGTLGLIASSDAVSSVGGSNGKIYVHNQVYGPGSVAASASEYENNISLVQFDGNSDNTFAGSLGIFTQGAGEIILAKSSAVAAPAGVTVLLGQNANLVIGGTGNQIGDQSTVSVYGGGVLNVSGNNVTVGTLAISNAPADLNPSQINSSVLIGLNVGISATTSTQFNPTINGNLNLNNFLNFNVAGGPQPLVINGNIEGNGFEKTGSGALQLNGNSTFFGDMEISAGSVSPLTAGSFGQPVSPYGVELNGGNLIIQGINVPAEPLKVWSSNSLFMAIDSCVWNGPVTLSQDLHLSAWAASTAGLATTFNGAISGNGGIYLDPVIVGNSPASHRLVWSGWCDERSCSLGHRIPPRA